MNDNTAANLDLTLEGTDGEEIRTYKLSEVLAGRPTVLAFYVYDFSPVCETQMCEMNDMEYVTLNEDVAVYGISTDGPYSHREFARKNGISYPLLSDPRKRVYEQFGLVEVTDDGRRQPRRGIVVLDGDGTEQYRWVADDNWDDWEVTPLDEANETVRRLMSA